MKKIQPPRISDIISFRYEPTLAYRHTLLYMQHKRRTPIMHNASTANFAPVDSPLNFNELISKLAIHTITKYDIAMITRSISISSIRRVFANPLMFSNTFVPYCFTFFFTVYTFPSCCKLIVNSIFNFCNYRMWH